MSAGLALTKAKEDSVSDSVNSVLAQDLADVSANGVEQTPTFFVNGKPLTQFSPKGLYDLVKSEIEAAKAGT